MARLQVEPQQLLQLGTNRLGLFDIREIRALVDQAYRLAVGEASAGCSLTSIGFALDCGVACHNAAGGLRHYAIVLVQSAMTTNGVSLLTGLTEAVSR
jgi:hypothetical protein